MGSSAENFYGFPSAENDTFMGSSAKNFYEFPVRYLLGWGRYRSGVGSVSSVASTVPVVLGSGPSSLNKQCYLKEKKRHSLLSCLNSYWTEFIWLKCDWFCHTKPQIVSNFIAWKEWNLSAPSILYPTWILTNISKNLFSFKLANISLR